MKWKIVIGFVVAVALAAAGVGIYFWVSGKNNTQIKLETLVVRKGNLNHLVTATGTIEPVKQINVGTQVSGVVQKIYVDFNSKVKAGQLIAELDKTNLKASLAEARASYSTAMNEQTYLQKIFDRQETLFNKKLISSTEYEDALYKLNNAKGMAEQKKSDVNRAATSLTYADIYSPINGVVLSKSVDVGQTVAASFSTPTLFTIAQDLSEMQVEADVDEADIGNVKQAQRVTFTVDAYPGEEFSGTVTQVRLNPTVTSNVVTYTVVIKAKNPDKKLMPGLTATISIYTLEIIDALTLEAKALNFNPDLDLLNKYYKQEKIVPPSAHMQNPGTDSLISKSGKENSNMVWVKHTDGIFSQMAITGESDGVSVQILQGLNEGDSVVFALKEVTETGPATKTSKSPFMPTPPGKKK